MITSYGVQDIKILIIRI